jgi:hypothetical protein
MTPWKPTVITAEALAEDADRNSEERGSFAEHVWWSIVEAQSSDDRFSNPRESRN